MAPELIPALLCHNEESFRTRLEDVDGLVEWVQIDVIDHTLYPNQSWADPVVIETWPIQSNLELHLMVSDPGSIIHAWKDVTNFKRAIWHVEATIDHHALIRETKKQGLEVGLAIAPSTPLDQLFPYLKDIDRVLVLGVEPGKSGQTLIPKTLKTVQELSSIHHHPIIAFDGGVTDETLPHILKAGAEAICAASLIFNHPPIHERLEEIRGRMTK